MKIYFTLFTLALTFAVNGCSTLCDDCDDWACSFRCRCSSYYAWYQMQPVYGDMQCGSDFGAGFRDGYSAMSATGTATAPSLPPRSYWGSGYQNEYGHQQMQAWFDGYAHGALVAEQNGRSQFTRIRTTEVAPRRGTARPEHKIINPESSLPQTQTQTKTPASSTPPVTLDGEEEVPVFKNKPEENAPELPAPAAQ